MSHDPFTLTTGQAHHLALAFARNDWTAAEVHKLCEGQTLRQVKSFINDMDSRFARELVALFQLYDIPRELLERLIDTHWSLAKSGGAIAYSERCRANWFVSAMDSFRGILQEEFVAIHKDDLDKLREAKQLNNRLKWEIEKLRNALVHFHRPVNEVFSKENCQRILSANELYSVSPAVRPRIMEWFDEYTIKTVADVTRRSEQEILRAPRLGRQSLLFIKCLLADMGLHLGMVEADYL